MIYSKITTLYDSISSQVNANGTNMEGRLTDLSLATVDKPFPIINLYPFQIPEDDEEINTAQLLVGFWFQDKPDTNESQRRQLIIQADELSDQFLQLFKAVKSIRVTGIIKEPQYKMYGGTVSGIALRFNVLSYAEC